MKRNPYCVIALIFLVGCGKKYADQPPRSPEESLKSIQINPDFKVDLFANEPMVYDPVEMVFDENGRIFVAEMLDYPEDPPQGKPPLSRIVMLEDTDGDGKIDRRTVFADHVLAVTGLMPWKGGLIVTATRDILWLKDSKGDGVADVRKVLYTGFFTGAAERRIANPRLNLDNWIYCNSGAQGPITSPEHPDRPPVLVRAADFRFRVDRDIAEPASGPTQFGQAVDDWGNRFITENTVHIRQVVLPMHYLVKAPTLVVGAEAQDISDHGRPSAQMFPLTKPQAWRAKRSQVRQERFDEQNPQNKGGGQKGLLAPSGYFTAASGGTVYNGDVFPNAYWGNIFTGDVSGNLVHRDVLERDGVNFIAHRGEQGKEFLASTDMWFRPTNFVTGPDGNLYFTDMHRETIEQPESIPAELKSNIDFMSGSDKGRIFRISPVHPLRQRDLKPKLGKASSAELVELLAGTSGWHRQTAHRLLLERQDRSVVPQLREMAMTNADPVARVNAFWVLESLSALDDPLLLHALHDAHPGVREHALRMAEPFLGKSPAVTNAALGMIRDPDARVEFQLALSLGEFQDPRTLPALAEIIGSHQEDRWFRLAVLSSASNRAAEMFETMVGRHQDFGTGEILDQLASLIGIKHDPNEVARFLASLGHAKTPEAGLAGLARGMSVAGVSELRVPGADATLNGYLQSGSEAVQTAAWEVARHLELNALVDRAARDAVSDKLPVKTRLTAILALRGGRYSAVNLVLRRILDSHQESSIQAAAIKSLAAFDDPKIGTTLLADWKSYGPEARTQVVAALLQQRDRIPILLTALEKGQIEIASIEIVARTRLMEDGNSAIASRAKAIFQNQNSDRAKVVAEFHDALKLNGDTGRGKKLFEDNCAKCHMPRRDRARVGPDLSSINMKTKEELLTSILNPSYAIDPRFTYYMVTTKDGRLYDGVISNETPGMITLRGGSDEGDETILRTSIAQMRASSLSLMPDGLEKGLGRQGLADVIAYLQGGL
ncbi:MAG TPA: PVC-type heme-binding CxxCH protein [Candidatus Acidoferrales bacterium]|nr:PVC-type heme-binding CxxCH protein [Candidatus Acidoferrales bacterium]